MRKLSLSLVISAFCIFVSGSQVQAQASRTWVSGLGDDVNPCSRTAPCKTFAGAISKTAAGGEINCLDPGGFGAVTIKKSISIVCESGAAGVLAPGTNGINISAGPSDIVVLRGLDIQGFNSGLNGIKFDTGGALHVENCIIRGFLGAPGHGILFAPSATSQLFVRDTVIADNNKGANAAAIFVQPTGSGTASGIIDNVKMLNGGNGLVVDGSVSTGNQMAVVMRNSVASGNSSNGLKVASAAGKTPARAIVDHSAIVTNATGISSAGTGADATVAYSDVTSNSTGLAFAAPGEIRSYQTNQIRGNKVTNGAFSSTIPLE